MKKPILVIAILIISVLFVFFFFGRKDDIKNYPPKSGPIVAFGDSLVYGTGSTNKGDFVSLLSVKIGEPITNLGVPGNTTADGFARIDTVLELEPRVTILLLGGNDFLRKVPREETFANLRSIIKQLQDSGSIVLLIGVRGGLLADNADNMFEDLANETHSAYVSNILSGLFTDSRYMSDAVHPNNAGYIRVAERVLPVLEKIRK